MKKTINIIQSLTLFASLILLFASCDDLLDLKPESKVSPANYLIDEAHLKAYISVNYTSSEYNQESGMFDVHNSNPTGSAYWRDTYTDNAMGRNGLTRFLPGSVRVPENYGTWNFDNIFSLNYYLQTVVPRLEAGSLTGAEANNRHYVGEGYFLRAQEYFYRLRKLGDFPIITKVLPDEQSALVEASKRQPRNEVARFILEDLDKSLKLLKNDHPEGKLRISRDAALLLKARVALFEATWLKYHAETALVPKGPGWPGATKDYLKDYNFPTGSLQGEIDFFLTEAMNASKEVADAIPLVENNKTIRETIAQKENPYYDMFASLNPSSYNEVIMYRAYDGDIKHGYNQGMYYGYSMGYTHQMEAAFLMENGLPIYAAGSQYKGDDFIGDTKKDRDWRWRLFMKAPGDVRALEGIAAGVVDIFPSPAEIQKRDYTRSTSTGYLFGKAISRDYAMATQDFTAFVVFRAAEAYLTYIEACYEKTGSIDAEADKYWRALRKRAGVDEDYKKTINATEMNKEAETDWAAYSHGRLVDATLYNIRRERRCEFIGEGHRWTDLVRWRAMDQLSGYQLEGCKIWGPMKSLYKASELLYGQANDARNIMSDPALSVYLRPLQISTKTDYYEKGYTFIEAHYLDPIAQRHFLVSSADGQTVETSPIYQNPHWPTTAGLAPDMN